MTQILRPLRFNQVTRRQTSLLALLLPSVALIATACSSDPTTENPVVGATIDANGDRVADDIGWAVDQNMDGVIDMVDLNSDGVIDGPGIDTTEDGLPNGTGLDLDNDGIYDAIDYNADGMVDNITQLGTGGAAATGGAPAGTGSVAGTGGAMTPGTGGVAPGTGGVAPGTGGAAPGTGGAVGTGGVATGGAVGTGGGSSLGCGITLGLSEPAAAMPTVGVVEFSTDLEGASSAAIEFGEDTTYGMTAPVDMAEPGFRTLLVGMAPERLYHYRIAVTAPSGTCYSEDMTITTGGLRNGVATPSAVSTGPNAAPGFIVIASGNTALILNKAGDVVWAFNFGSGGGGFGLGMFSAKLSWDGKYMIARDLGEFDAGDGGTFHSVKLDGTEQTQFDVLGGDHHDFDVTPDGLLYIAKTNGGMDECDKIYTANYDGSEGAPLADMASIFANDIYPTNGEEHEECHVNAIHYYHDAGIITASDREKDVIGVFDSNGQPIRAIGQAPAAAQSTFQAIVAEGTEGQPDSAWRVQHGHHHYADDKLVVFSNGPMGTPSEVLHYTINGDNTASIDWRYDVPMSGTQGDATHLPNGNFLLTSSAMGFIEEITPDLQRVGEYQFSGVGYVNHRPTLYGPPPGR